eukprot:2167642-Pleurochrysis_carterae.AAC.1
MKEANQGASSSTNEEGKKPPPPQFARRMKLTKKAYFKKPFIKIDFDSSLGYPGEGPKITFASANIRGSVSDNKFYR